VEAFDTHGVWWLPEASEKKCSGTLSCSETGELRLTVMGGFSEHPSDFERTNAIIFGEVVDDRLGQQVTLRDCFLTNWTQSSNPTANRQEFFAHRGFFGGHLASEEDFYFRSAHVSFSGLAAWAHDLSGFARGDDGFTISWKHPDPIGGVLLGGRFTLGAGCSSSGTWREKRLTEDVGLHLSYTAAIYEADLQLDFVYPLQNLFTFATDRPNALTKLRVSRGPLPTEQISVVGPKTFTDESAVADLTPWDMLFSLADVTGRVDEVFRLWLDLSKRYSGAFAIYFGNIYRPSGYSDFRFFITIQALSLYQARREGVANSPARTDQLIGRVTEHLPSDLSKTIKSLLDSHPLVAAERALEILTKEHQGAFEPLVTGSNGGGSERFVAYALNTLRYVLTNDTSNSLAASTGSELHWLTERIAFLFKIALLKELRFTAEQVRTLLDRNPLYIHIRDKIRLGGEKAQELGDRAGR
jgi:ApeA N-terminal domain 1